MALIPGSTYPTQVAPYDAGWPGGKAQNEIVEGDGSGTPLEAAWVNDLWGFQQALLAEAPILATGTPDRVGASQYLDALKAIFYARGLVDGFVATLEAADAAIAAAKVTGSVARYTIDAPATYDIDDPMSLTVSQADAGYTLTGGNTIQVDAKGWYLVTFSMLVSLSSTSDGASAEAWIKVGGSTKLRSTAKRPGSSGNVGLASSCPVWVETPATDTIQLIARHGTGTQSVIAATQANLGIMRIGAPA